MKTSSLLFVSCLALTVFILPNQRAFAQDGSASTELRLVQPNDGEHFQPGDIIPLRASLINETNGPWRVLFFDGDRHLGETSPNGTVWWEDASGGPHVITARAMNSAGTILSSAPANILVGPGPTLPVVQLYSAHWKTLEPCPACDVAPGVLTFKRTMPTNEPLVVFLQTDGTATSDEDYPALPTHVVIPAGQTTTHFELYPVDDQLVEGPEVVRVRLVTPPDGTAPTYLINVSQNEALVVIGDDERGAPEVRLDIVEPKEGTYFALGATIQLSAISVWTRSEVFRPVEFYDGNMFIGQSGPGPLRPPIPCLPNVHTIQWTNPSTGQHVLTARTELSLNLWATSPPVRITVSSEPPPVVRIETTEPIAEEDSTPFDHVNWVGEFTISRTGPTNASLPVYVQYSGSATAGADYTNLPWLVSIPAGATSTVIRVVALNDSVPEGIETLVATISNCPPPGLRPPCYVFEIDPVHASATVFIRDDGITEASLAITRPTDGASFNVGETILIEATAIDLNGYISRVEFFDGHQRIGESEIVFILPPDPGTPILHSFEWHGAASGPHVLTARATSTVSVAISSQPVHITVGPGSNQPPRIALTRPVDGAEFPLNAPIEIVAQASDPDGFVRRAEFFADGRKIGEQSIVFIQPPPPGQTQTFTFVWHFPAPGAHTLTARAMDDAGATAVSAPVNIRVTLPDLLPVVTVVARDAFAVEPGSNTVLNTASFRIRRFGPTNDPLVVNYSLHGTAQNGVDYETLSGLATIPAGRRTMIVIVRPLPDDLAEGIETVILRLEDPTGEEPPRYRVGFPRSAVALIRDYPWIHPPGGARCVPLQEGMRHVCFAAQTAYNFRVEASIDLRNWETLCNTLAADGAVHFADDESASLPYRFYRVAPEPVADADD
jgi:hypothetical protein